MDVVFVQIENEFLRGLMLIPPGSRIEILVVIRHQHIVQNRFLCGRHRGIGTLPNQENQIGQKFYFFDVELFLVHQKRIHGDWFFFSVLDVSPAFVFAGSRIGISRVHNDHVIIVGQVLLNDIVHQEGLSRT